MRQMRFIALTDDEAALILSDDNGEQYRLTIDERLRSAARGEGARLGQQEIMMESSLRPAEIQARLRSGQSPEEIARSASMPVERVLRFAGPVLQERAQVVQKARATRSRPLADGEAPVLGEAVDSRLARAGMDPETARWDAGRREDGTWQITVQYGSGRQAGTAAWVYDPASQHVRPSDDTARELLTGTGPEDPNLEEVSRPFSLVRRAGEAAAKPKPKPAAAPAKPAREEEHGRRATVPSWDDIVFGVRGQRG
jgi:hypothetical protein